MNGRFPPVHCSQIKREFLICERIAGIFVAGDIIVCAAARTR
jgi:hypothetical protein